MSSLENCRVVFGRRLKSLRIEKGLSQKHLADKSGVDRGFISACEHGKSNASLETICRLAAALEIPPDELLKTIGQNCEGMIGDIGK